jgi:MraZ protein
MFSGHFDHVLDDKGRTSLPKEFRSLLAGRNPPTLTRLRYCLAIFPAEEFEGLKQRLSDTSTTLEDVQRLQRLFIGGATPCTFDRQGRILIPQELRKWAKLGREITVMGLGSRIEIWNRGELAADLEGTRENYPELTRGLKEFKI